VWDIRGFTREANVDKEMRRLVQKGAASYLEFDLPKLYHGLVHRRCLMAVRDKSGAYFGGLSPDIFASVALGCVARRVVVTDYPLTIPGACGASGSVVEGALGTHSRRLEDAPHFRHRGPYQWSEHVPRVYTVQTLWADSALAALRAMDRADLVSQLNYSRLAAHCIAANLDVARPVVSDLLESMRGRRENRLSGLIRLAISFVTGPGSKFAARVWNRLMMIVGWRSVHRIDGLTSMSEVSHALVRYLDRKGLRFTGGACRSAGRVQVRRDACPVRSEP
jgi:hypothetical protein